MKKRNNRIGYFILTDMLSFLISFSAAFALRFYVKLPLLVQNPEPDYNLYIKMLGWIFFLEIFTMVFSNSYQYVYGKFNLREFISVLKNMTLSTAFILSVTFFYKQYMFSRAVVLFNWFFAVAAVSLGHLILKSAAEKIRKKRTESLIIYGNSKKEILSFYNSLTQEIQKMVIGYSGDNDFHISLKYLGKKEVFFQSKKTEINKILAVSSVSEDEIKFLKRKAEDFDCTLKLIPSYKDLLGKSALYDDKFNQPLISITAVELQYSQKIVKRIIDVLISSAVLIIGSPLWIIVALLIKITSKGPVFFIQKRVGSRGELFKIFKFRTMFENADEIKDSLENEKEGPLFKIKNDPRITGFGRFLRKTSIDEIPQMFNVLKGEMSLVGPRPALPEEVEEYDKKEYFDRLAVRPGISGLWQVSGRSDLDFEDMMKLDLYYVENWSIYLDIWIIIKTFKVVFTSEGAY